MQQEERSNITEELMEIMDKIQVVCNVLILTITDETQRKENQTLLYIILDYMSQGQSKVICLQEQMKKAFE